ncbi:hypothetical protein [Streptomyces sp. NRRL S-337]|nr:hypothetical protein [Streptomyces sp. NRRL S-337]
MERSDSAGSVPAGAIVVAAVIAAVAAAGDAWADAYEDEDEGVAEYGEE